MSLRGSGGLIRRWCRRKVLGSGAGGLEMGPGSCGVSGTVMISIVPFDSQILERCRVTVRVGISIVLAGGCAGWIQLVGRAVLGIVETICRPLSGIISFPVSGNFWNF